MVRVGTRKNWIFPKFVKDDPRAVATLLVVLKGNNFERKFFVSFHVGLLIMFESAPESIKKSISRSGV